MDPPKKQSTYCLGKLSASGACGAHPDPGCVQRAFCSTCMALVRRKTRRLLRGKENTLPRVFSLTRHLPLFLHLGRQGWLPGRTAEQMEILTSATAPAPSRDAGLSVQCSARSDQPGELFPALPHLTEKGVLSPTQAPQQEAVRGRRATCSCGAPSSGSRGLTPEWVHPLCHWVSQLLFQVLAR